ncbi:hypothetical protein B0H14DRAFT_2592505 [Mycena olivaceomarginata]|nr:hypothetical protein B0H14DRAFT_2592505 [Mycena olivaceomarginata]
MAPKSGFRVQEHCSQLKAAPKPAPGKTCHQCTREIPLNQSLLQHDRICCTTTQNRLALIDHVRQRIRNHAESSNDSEAGASAMDINNIIQLPTHQIHNLMDLDEDLPVLNEDTPAPDNFEDAVPTVSLPSRFIFVKHHPHANKPNEIIPLDSFNSFIPLSKNDSHPAPLPDARPWAPFKTYSDYKLHHAVSEGAPPTAKSTPLHFLGFGVSKVSNSGALQFHRKTLRIDFEGVELSGTHKVEIEFRDPWQIIKQWVTDETLAPLSTWFSQEKILSPSRTALAVTWGFTSGSDKGLVSTKVKMHPILFRACWIHSATRNGSGNGGSALAGFVKNVCGKLTPNTLTGLKRSEYDRLKHLIYRGVCHFVMASLEQWSHNGEALCFGDGVMCAAFPGVLIESMDFEELAAWLAIRNLTSLHPCLQCLVHKDDLPRLTKTFLSQYGLHDFENSSDGPVGYDCLHFFDGGVWGRHMWPLIKGYLQQNGLASKFNTKSAQSLMQPHGQLPPLAWSQAYLIADHHRLLRQTTFLDILILISIKFTADYEKNQDVSATHGKSFNFLKQHFLLHAIACSKTKAPAEIRTRGWAKVFSKKLLPSTRKQMEKTPSTRCQSWMRTKK